MNLYIDCEWNGFGGELLSMALVPEDPHITPFHVRIRRPPSLELDPWVAENVMPKIDALWPRPTWEGHLPHALAAYLANFDEVCIIADWPEDIERFCRALILGPGKRISTPPLSFRIVRVDVVSAIPHNALADAQALALWGRSQHIELQEDGSDEQR